MGASLRAIAPELALAAAILALVVVDLLLRGEPRRRVVLGAAALIGLAAAAIGLALLPAERGPIFGGMLALDSFGLFFKGLFLVAAALGVLFGASSDEIPRGRFGEYLILLLSLTLGMSLLASARNLLMIYLAIELVSLPSYILAGFRRGDRATSEAALKYVVYGAAASGLMLYGFSWLYGLTGTLDLAGVGHAIGGALAGGPAGAVMQGAAGAASGAASGVGLRGAAGGLGLALALLFSLVGFGYKIAAVPFHMWCPDVYQGAPTPFVAFLSVGPKAAGFAALLRFLLMGFGSPADAPAAGALPWPALIGILAIATMTLGNLVAIAQENVKRLLAYSSIAHAGYMLMAVAVGSEAAVRAVMLYLPIYLFMNMGAFLAVMAVRAQTGSESIGAYRGLGSRSPWLALSLAVFLFSLTGLPPLAGFIGKFYLFAALVKTGETLYYVIAILGVLNSVVSLYYYVRIVRAMYLERPEEGVSPSFSLPSPTAALLGLCVVPTVLLGVWWGPLAGLIEGAARMVR